MKKIFLSFIIFLFINAQAITLKGGVSEEYIPKGFYGSWGVISKLQETNNSKMFNYQSKDIWILSGYSDILVLQNLESGAISEIRVKEKTTDGKTLKFNREKVLKKGDEKIVYKETVQFKLSGNKFSGSDDFIVEKYNNKDILIERSEANYRVEGVKISGATPE